MRKIQPDLTSELALHFGDPGKIGASMPYKVSTFRELVEHVAKLSFKNKDYLLFYRGQSNDYINKAGSSTFYPSIYRGDYLPAKDLVNRFDILEGASKILVNHFEQYNIEGFKELKRRKSIQWSILQHYEVCATPLLDFTHSLRVACSFATIGNKQDKAYVFIFGLPYLTNRISINSEHDIINIRLLSICPPTALRPYFQEGYLVGTDDVTTDFESKSELDFNNRLIAKFEIPNSNAFWGNEFNKIPENFLYPENDPIRELCQEIKELANKELKAGDLGEFLKSWAKLEQNLLSLARNRTKRPVSVREAIKILYELGIILKTQLYQFESLRKFRNLLVHTPQDISSNEVKENLFLIDEMQKLVFGSPGEE